jgi:hypothetical protein
MAGVLSIHRKVDDYSAADIRLGNSAEKFGIDVRTSPGYLKSIGSHIQARICDNKSRPVPQIRRSRSVKQIIGRP